MKKYSALTIALMSLNAWAGNPVFSVTPNVSGQPQLVMGQQGTYTYQITNNTKFTLSNIGLLNLQGGVSVASNNYGYQYCSFPLTLASNTSCLLKLNVNSNLSPAKIYNGPQICFRPDKPAYCSQPLNPDQINTQVMPGPLSLSCWDNVSNFNFTLTQNFDTGVVDTWGPGPATFAISTSNPDLSHCAATAGVKWSQQRVLAAIDFWIRQKLNYCHHHVPDYATPLANRGSTQGGYCNQAVSLLPGPNYGKVIRWNYSGTGSETMQNWVNNNYMWYGVDCSDFTKFYYNFALSGAGIPTFPSPFDSDTGYQAGQATNGTQSSLSPNQQVPGNPSLTLQPYSSTPGAGAAGTLLCADGSLEHHGTTWCGNGANPYMSTLDNQGASTLTITDKMLGYLLPGDILFLAFPNNPENIYQTSVTHAITWTGKKVGDGPNDIPASRIAPDSICPNNWQPHTGDWVIADSHYQGADYRVFTTCFYRTHVWGVRRVIQ